MPNRGQYSTEKGYECLRSFKGNIVIIVYKYNIYTIIVI